MPITKAKRAAQAGVVVRQIRAATTLPHVASTIEVGCLDMSDPECTSATLLVSHIYQKVGPSLCSRRQLLWCAERRPLRAPNAPQIPTKMSTEDYSAGRFRDRHVRANNAEGFA